jgi:hypothetical protein
MGVNILALIYSCISRPYKDSLINAHTIINDVGVIAVTAAFYPMRDVFQRDEKFFYYGKIVIGIIAGIIFVNFALFLISFALGILTFIKKCPICSICIRKPKREKEKIIRDPLKPID